MSADVIDIIPKGRNFTSVLTQVAGTNNEGRFGGIMIERHRHVAAGAIEGCVFGAVVGGVAGGAIALATGGAASPVVPGLVSIGCGFGAAGGAIVGYPLDDYLLQM